MPRHPVLIPLSRDHHRDLVHARGLSLIGGTPEQFGATVAEETAKRRKVIRDAHIPAPA